MGEWMAKAYFIIAVAIMVLMILATVIKTLRRGKKDDNGKKYLPEENIIY